ncbi:DNA-binding FadR family transcriptional regulator [Erwinia toletana]|uniref:DNA-binding FadR family transcriptional regulator n=1 Tax=Winslowiella toletana TaxID=92490 RepID=A0ABS4P8G8_9GAMM|nr:GntR family transcriptional regulator [Winslowiella toletana]MBP2168927.1 DNA-binding FadR family transcriptional regulator [Winslowiella toletana]
MGDTPASAANSSSALDKLRQLILQHDIQPDQALPAERELAERFAVGRREIRRALDVLEEEGRIWRKQGKGTFVGPAAPVQPLVLQDLPQQSNLLEVMEARIQLEPGLARLAALRASKEQIALMQRLLERMHHITLNDGDQHELWDSAFHRAIAEAAGNRLMLGLFDAIDAVRREPAWQHLREQATLAIASAIITEASLSFLGLGQQPPDPSWGAMLNTAKGYLEQAPWMSIFPGIAIFLTVQGFNLLGDGLRDALDPRND